MIHVYTSSVIDAPADAVWARIRDFNALPQWHPGIADSRIENSQPSDRVGCVRHFHTRDGGTIRERLLALSDYDKGGGDLDDAMHFTRKAVASAEVRESFAKQGLEAATNSPEEFEAMLRAEIAKWSRVVKETGVTVN